MTTKTDQNQIDEIMKMDISIAGRIERIEKATKTKVQSIIFDGEKYDAAKAKKWAAVNDFRNDKVDDTEGSVRLRQFDPDACQAGSFRTITLTDGVKASICKPKGGTNIGKSIAIAGSLLERDGSLRDGAAEFIESVAKHANVYILGDTDTTIEKMEGVSNRCDDITECDIVLTAKSAPADDDGYFDKLLSKCGIEKQDYQMPRNSRGWTCRETSALVIAEGYFSKAGVNYQEPSPVQDKVCSGCEFFARTYYPAYRGTYPEEGNRCRSVNGAISPIGICDLYINATEQAKSIRAVYVQKEDDTDEINVDFEKTGIIKAEEHDDYTYILAPVLVPNKIDKQGDKISADEIEKAAHDFMLESQRAGLLHRIMLRKGDAVVVESYITRADATINKMKIAKGTWMVGMRIYNKDIRKRIKEGKFAGFSIGGHGKRSEAKG